MPKEKLRDLAISRELNDQVKSVAAHIMMDLEKEVIWHHPNKFTPLAIFVFGSLLDNGRFDCEISVGKRSDFDFIVVVAENFIADDFYRIGGHCSPSNVANFVMLRHHIDPKDDWNCDRDVDVVVMSPQNIDWEISRIESLTDEEVIGMLVDDAYLTALASGVALLNHLDEHQLKGLFRLQRIYHSLDVKTSH